MNCGNAIKIMEKLDQARQGTADLTISEQDDFQNLLQAGFFADTTIQPVDFAEINEKKIDLANLQSRNTTLREDISRLSENKESIRLAGGKTEISRREKELEGNLNLEKKIRTEILELSAKASSTAASIKVGSKSYILTFKAREIMEEIYARFARVKDMELVALEREIQQLQTLFESSAQKALKILKLISPKFRTIEEIHLRSAATGLSLRPELPEIVSNAYSTTMDLLVFSGIEVLAQNRVYIAECLVNNAQDLTPENIKSTMKVFSQIYSRCINYVGDAKDALNCALLLHPSGLSIDLQEKFLKDGVDLAQAQMPKELGPEIPVAPFILLLLSNSITTAEKVSGLGTRFIISSGISKNFANWYTWVLYK